MIHSCHMKIAQVLEQIPIYSGMQTQRFLIEKMPCKNHIVVLAPANYTPQAKNKIGDTIENEFNYMTDRLLRLHMDFDYLDEDVFCDQCRRSSISRPPQPSLAL